MPDNIVVNETEVSFQSSFAPASFIGPTKTKIEASGHPVTEGSAVCVMGDEGGVELQIDYTSGAFSVPGKGKITIWLLLPDHVAKKTKSKGTPVLLQGGDFLALFTVSKPAQMPAPANTQTPCLFI